MDASAAATEGAAPNEARRRWMAVLARARPELLEAAWRDRADKPRYSFLRRPESGLVMVRGRAGGTGQRFNLGEMLVTRCVVRLEGGGAGCAYVRGRDARHAELAAVFDGLLQDPARRAELLSQVIEPEAARQAARRDARARKVAATRVEFFTMVRGEG